MACNFLEDSSGGFQPFYLGESLLNCADECEKSCSWVTLFAQTPENQGHLTPACCRHWWMSPSSAGFKCWDSWCTDCAPLFSDAVSRANVATRHANP